MWKVDCVHRSMPFYSGDLSIHGLMGPGTNALQILRDNQILEESKAGGSMWIFDCTGVGTPTPRVVQGSTVL